MAVEIYVAMPRAYPPKDAGWCMSDIIICNSLCSALQCMKLNQGYLSSRPVKCQSWGCKWISKEEEVNKYSIAIEWIKMIKYKLQPSLSHISIPRFKKYCKTPPTAHRPNYTVSSHPQSPSVSLEQRALPCMVEMSLDLWLCVVLLCLS